MSGVSFFQAVMLHKDIFQTSHELKKYHLLRSRAKFISWFGGAACYQPPLKSISSVVPNATFNASVPKAIHSNIPSSNKHGNSVRKAHPSITQLPNLIPSSRILGECSTHARGNLAQSAGVYSFQWMSIGRRLQHLVSAC